MARTQHKPRKIALDPKYQSVLVTRLMNYVMKDGKKSLAQGIVYDAFDMVEKQTNEKALDVFLKYVDEVKPSTELKTRPMKGQPVRFPVSVSPARQLILVLRWCVEAARLNKGKKTIAASLADENMAGAQGEGGALKRKNNLYKSAQAHKAYSHLK